MDQNEQIQQIEDPLLKLLKIIISIQSVYDQTQPSSEIAGSRRVPCLLFNLLTTQAEKNKIEQLDNWQEDHHEAWISKERSLELYFQQLERISLNFGMDPTMAHYLPLPLTDEWWSLWEFTHCMMTCSVVQVGSGIDDCSVCIDGFLLGKPYIRLRCHPAHRIHEECLADLIVNKPDYKCPICRQDSYPRPS
ncbi:uncharacterized protein MELLADRAFT_102863 [Melampsora larici-populina 98AG31]|uniref:RING-type domain-containing protein n=1 Tax=Melampsora larici-populina (strain 98AG31 / pathotype 3-4-7) TaxID=747676 RepID=F4R9M7_MELLP|nr:uncharacterized protein MELLADRAFT_102863 [Melampsora larici-populina 98AG31]EGG11123.1 hypothetical protein MELLADRAFT_102863 [Melampsora larici-populina 98AG31]